MNNPTQHRSWFLGRHRRVAGAALALAITLVPAVVATRSAQAQTFNVLYTFTGGTDGGFPWAGLVLDAQGNLYGTTGGGGDLACNAGYGCGTVFKLDTTGKETVLYSFTGAPDGGSPVAGLVRDAQGNLYGTTEGGGTYGYGTVFKLDTTGKEAVLYSFNLSPDGASPWAGLVLDAPGNLYGTTPLGGDFACSSLFGRGCGTVFKVDTTGKVTVLYDFKGKRGDGANPWAGLVLDAPGNLYGTTYCRGAHNKGTVFKMDTTGKETVLYSFNLSPDGANPRAGLVLDAQGNLYGTTYGGGAHKKGTVFRVDTTGKETVLYSFAGARDGARPRAGLVLDAQGNLYGTTYIGGAHKLGTVFKVDTTGKETVLHTFTEAGVDGAYPQAGLVLDAQGNLYGTTLEGGAYGAGTVFKLTP